MYGRLMDALPVITIELATSEALPAETLHSQAAWSDDGTTFAFAFADADGLWHFDFFEEAQPHQLLTRDDVNAIRPALAVPSPDVFVLPAILEVSTTGRYVRIGSSLRWTLIDTRTNTFMPGTIVSPDETRLVVFGPTDEGQFPSLPLPEGSRPRPDDRPCYVPLRLDCATVVGTEGRLEIREIAWEAEDMIMIWHCLPESHQCNIRHRTLTPGASYSGAHNLRETGLIEFGRQIIDLAYDVQNDLLALVVDDYLIRLGEFSNSPEIDLTDKLDSPIARIEWGHSVWYVDR
jgi:hypothetical protein